MIELKWMGLVGIVWVALLGGCRKSQSDATESTYTGPLQVYVVNYPLQYFAERIGGDLVEVYFPAPGEGDPAYWSPSVETISAYQQADLILLNGADYADWIRMVSLPSAKTVDTGRNNTDAFIALEEHVTHSHGPEGDHAHGGYAFTTWLDPSLAVEQSRAILQALGRALPDQQVVLEQRFAGLRADLLSLDEDIQGTVMLNPKQPLVFSHPVYQYFVRRYGLNGKSVHWEPDAAPTELMWESLQSLLTEHHAKWMVWEGEPMPAVVARLKQLGVNSIVFNPCGNVPETGDYLEAMQRNIQGFQRLFSE